MAHTDSQGSPIATVSDLAAGRCRSGIDLFLSAWPGAAETLGGAVAAGRKGSFR